MARRVAKWRVRRSAQPLTFRPQSSARAAVLATLLLLLLPLTLPPPSLVATDATRRQQGTHWRAPIAQRPKPERRRG